MPVNGVPVRLYAASLFVDPPVKDTALPVGSPIDSTTTGTNHGFDGAYRFCNLNPGHYYVAAQHAGHILWDDLAVPLIKQSVYIALMHGFTPAATGADAAEVYVPYSPGDGTTSLTYNVRRIDFRLVTAGGTPGLTVQKWSGSGAFTPTTVGTVTMVNGEYQASTTTSLGTIQSGDKLRVSVDSLGSGAEGWFVALLAEEN